MSSSDDFRTHPSHPFRASVTWHKSCDDGGQVPLWNIQNTVTIACVPAWWILYYGTVGCKGPIWLKDGLKGTVSHICTGTKKESELKLGFQED